jgi:hypothetical protein
MPDNKGDTMRTLWIIAFSASLLACDTDGLRDSDSGIAAEQTDTAAVDIDTDPDPARLACASESTYDFRQRGEGLDALEGALVWVSAVQPASDPEVAGVTVLLESVISYGAFDVACPDSLEENYIYPSSAVVIDADDSGDCSAGDLIVVSQWYGWDSDMIGVVKSTSELVIIGDQTTWGGRGLCDYYVPDSLLSE